MGAKCGKLDKEEERIRRQLFLQQSATSTTILDRYATISRTGSALSSGPRPQSGVSTHSPIPSSPQPIRRTQSTVLPPELFESSLGSNKGEYEFRASNSSFYPLGITEIKGEDREKGFSDILSETGKGGSLKEGKRKFSSGFFESSGELSSGSRSESTSGGVTSAPAGFGGDLFGKGGKDKREEHGSLDFPPGFWTLERDPEVPIQPPQRLKRREERGSSEFGAVGGERALWSVEPEEAVPVTPPPRLKRRSEHGGSEFGAAGGELAFWSTLDRESTSAAPVTPPPRLKRKRLGSNASSIASSSFVGATATGRRQSPVGVFEEEENQAEEVKEPPKPVARRKGKTMTMGKGEGQGVGVGGDVPVFVREMSDVAVKVGTRARLLVEVDPKLGSGEELLKITWFRNDVKITIPADAPTSRIHQTSEGRFHYLDISPVITDDEGKWVCVAENFRGRSSCACQVKVMVPKSYRPPEFVEGLRAVLTEAGTVSLECKVIGTPTPLLKWYKDGVEIKAGDIFALRGDPSSLGVYTCEATNCMGSVTSSSRVHVNDSSSPHPPHIQVTHPLQDSRIRVGERLDLQLALSKHLDDTYQVTWYNKSNQIPKSDRVIQRTEGNICALYLNPVEIQDDGEWVCEIGWGKDKIVCSCTLSILVPRNYRRPKFLEDLKAILTEEGLVSFECKVCGFPTPILHWYKDGYELKPGDVYQLSGANSLGRYSCIAHNCMGDAESSTELTLEDIQHQLSDDERKQLIAEGLGSKRPPKFVSGLKSVEVKIGDSCELSIEVNDANATIQWLRDGTVIEIDSGKEIGKYSEKKERGCRTLLIRELEFEDQAEWKCQATNEYGHSVSSAGVKLIIPGGYKKPKFLESLRAVLSEEGTVNLECKVIGVPVPILKWYKDGVELKAGDIHRIISGADGTCCLGTYTCVAKNCMGEVSSSAALLGFEDKLEKEQQQQQVEQQAQRQQQNLTRDPSLSTIMEERTSQMLSVYETMPNVPKSIEEEDGARDISVSIDGKDVSVSLYETPDLTENDAKAIIEMFANEYSEYISEHNVIPLPSLRFVKETSTSGKIVMEAVIIDVSEDPFDTAKSASMGGVLREDPTEADYNDDEFSDSFESPMELSATSDVPEGLRGSRQGSLREKRKHSESLSRRSSEKKRKAGAAAAAAGAGGGSAHSGDESSRGGRDVTPHELEMFGEQSGASVYLSAESDGVRRASVKSEIEAMSERLEALEQFERMMGEKIMTGELLEGFEVRDQMQFSNVETLKEGAAPGAADFGARRVMEGEASMGLAGQESPFLFENIESLGSHSMRETVIDDVDIVPGQGLEEFTAIPYSNIGDLEMERDPSMGNAEEVNIFGGDKFIGIEMAEMVLEGADTFSEVDSLTIAAEKMESGSFGGVAETQVQEAQQPEPVVAPPRKKKLEGKEEKADIELKGMKVEEQAAAAAAAGRAKAQEEQAKVGETEGKKKMIKETIEKGQVQELTGLKVQDGAKMGKSEMSELGQLELEEGKMEVSKQETSVETLTSKKLETVQKELGEVAAVKQQEAKISKVEKDKVAASRKTSLQDEATRKEEAEKAIPTRAEDSHEEGRKEVPIAPKSGEQEPEKPVEKPPRKKKPSLTGEEAPASKVSAAPEQVKETAGKDEEKKLKRGESKEKAEKDAKQKESKLTEPPEEKKKVGEQVKEKSEEKVKAQEDAEPKELGRAKTQVDQGGADEDAKKKADLDAKEKGEKEAKLKSEKEAKEKAEKEAKEKEARETKEKEAKLKSDKEAQEKAEKEAKEKSENEKKEKLAKEAKEKEDNEKKEKLAKEKAEKDAKEKEENEKREKLAKEKAEKDAKEKEKEMADKDAKGKEKADKEAKEKEAKLKAENEAKEKAKKEAEEKEAKLKAEKEKAEKQAKEKEAKEKADMEAKKKAQEEAKLKEEKEKAERDAKEKAEREAKEKEAKLKTEKEAKEKAEKEAKLKAEKEAEVKAEKDAKEKEAKEKAEKEAKLKAEKEAKEKAEKEAKEKEAKEKAEKEAKEKEAKLKAEKEAKEKAEKEAKLKAEKEANDKAEKEEKTEAEKEAEGTDGKEEDAKAKAEKDAKDKAEKEAKLKAEKEAKEKADKEAKEKAEKEAKEKEAKLKAEKEAKEKSEKEAKDKAEKEAKEKEAKLKAEKEAKEKSEKEASEKEAKLKAEKEAKEKAEKESKEKADKEAKLKVEKEAKEKAEKEANEKKEKEAKEKEAKLKAEKEAKEKAEKEAKEKADKEAKEKTEKEAKLKAEKEAKEKADKDAKLKAEKDAKEKADKEAREKADKDAKEKTEKDGKAKAEQEAKEKAEKEAKLKADKEAKEKADKDAKLKAEKDAKEKADKEAKEKAEQEAKQKAGKPDPEQEVKAKAEQEATEKSEKLSKQQSVEEAKSKDAKAGEEAKGGTDSKRPSLEFKGVKKVNKIELQSLKLDGDDVKKQQGEQSSGPSTPVETKELGSPKGEKESTPKRGSVDKKDEKSGKEPQSPKKDEPSSPKEKPGSIKDKSASPKEPLGPKEKSASPKDEPSSPKEKPGSVKDKSASPKEEPGSPKEEPGSPKEKPGSAKSRSGSTKDEPASPKEEPTSPKSKPGSVKKDQPAASKKEEPETPKQEEPKSPKKVEEDKDAAGKKQPSIKKDSTKQAAEKPAEEVETKEAPADKKKVSVKSKKAKDDAAAAKPKEKEASPTDSPKEPAEPTQEKVSQKQTDKETEREDAGPPQKTARKPSVEPEKVESRDSAKKKTSKAASPPEEEVIPEKRKIPKEEESSEYSAKSDRTSTTDSTETTIRKKAAAPIEKSYESQRPEATKVGIDSGESKTRSERDYSSSREASTRAVERREYQDTTDDYRTTKKTSDLSSTKTTHDYDQVSSVRRTTDTYRESSPYDCPSTAPRRDIEAVKSSSTGLSYERASRTPTRVTESSHHPRTVHTSTSPSYYEPPSYPRSSPYRESSPSPYRYNKRAHDLQPFRLTERAKSYDHLPGYFYGQDTFSGENRGVVVCGGGGYGGRSGRALTPGYSSSRVASAQNLIMRTHDTSSYQPGGGSKTLRSMEDLTLMDQTHQFSRELRQQQVKAMQRKWKSGWDQHEDGSSSLGAVEELPSSENGNGVPAPPPRLKRRNNYQVKISSEAEDLYGSSKGKGEAAGGGLYSIPSYFTTPSVGYSYFSMASLGASSAISGSFHALDEAHRMKKPRFSMKLQNRTTPENTEVVKFACTVFGTPDPTIQWYKNGLPIFSDRQKYLITSNCGVVTLDIHNADKNDTGEYTCFARNFYGKAASTAILQVVGIEESAASKAYVSGEGSCSSAGTSLDKCVPICFNTGIIETPFPEVNELVLECQVKGSPRPDVMWMKNGQTIITYGQTTYGRFRADFTSIFETGKCRLIIQRPRESDSGVYTCVGRNYDHSAVGRKLCWTDEVTKCVNVKGGGQTSPKGGLYASMLPANSSSFEYQAPRFISELEPFKRVRIGEDIALTVEITGVPQPDVRWFHHKNTIYPIKSTQHTRIISEAPGVHTLYIPQSDPFDLGTYTVRVTNKYGMVESSCSVSELIPGINDSPTLSGIRAGKKPLELLNVPPCFVKEPREFVCLRYGDELVVECEVEGWPQVSVNLYRGCRNVTLQPRAHKELNPSIPVSPTNTQQHVKFTLTGISCTDFGMYTVEAKNIIGVAKAFVNVKLLDGGHLNPANRSTRSMTPGMYHGGVSPASSIASSTGARPFSSTSSSHYLLGSMTKLDHTSSYPYPSTSGHHHPLRSISTRSLYRNHLSNHSSLTNFYRSSAGSSFNLKKLSCSSHLLTKEY